MSTPTWPVGYQQNVTIEGTPSGAKVRKSSGAADTYNAVARTLEVFSTAGYIECSIDAADKVWFGLTNATTVANLTTFSQWKHSISVADNSTTVNINTDGSYVTDTAQTLGQRNTWRFDVFDSGGGVYKARIYLNGVLKHTYTTALTLPIAAGILIATSSAYGDSFVASGMTVPNQAPTVDVGVDREVTVGGTPVSFTPSVSDDGLPSNTLTYSWTKQSGPGTVTFGTPTTANTTVACSAEGAYVVRLTVSDGSLSSYDEATVVATVAAVEPVPPSTYNLRTDTAVVLWPTLPTMGAKGSTITDPNFGTPITRITDSTDSLDGRNWGTPSGAASCAWAADDKYFYVMDDQGSTCRIYAFNPTTRAITFDHEFGCGVDMTFARPITKHRVMYGTEASNSLLIKKYNIISRQWSTIYDLKTDVPTANPYQGACYSSKSPKEYISVCFDGQQETWRYITVLNPDDISDRFTIDCNTAQVKIGGGSWQALLNYDGSTATLSGGMSLHSTDMDKSGTWAWIGTAGPASHVAWFNTTTHRVHEVNNAKWLGHHSLGYETHVSMNAVGADIPFQWYFTDFTQGGVFPTHRSLISPSQSPGEWNATDHSSWNNCQSDRLVPIISETQMVWQGTVGTAGVDYPSQGANFANWSALWEEIAAVATASGKTYGVDATFRACHHRMRQVDDTGHYVYTFRDSPRLQVSHDGMNAIFTSNWGLSLGTYGSYTTAYGGAAPQRRDAFMVYMDMGQASPTQRFTTIKGSLYANGTKLTTGRLYLTPHSFVRLGRDVIVPKTISYDIPVSGDISLPLAPSVDGVQYDVEFDPDPADTSTPFRIKPGYFADTWSVPADYAATVANTSGLLAYWRLDETAGINAYDTSGNGHTGTYSGVTLGSAGAITENAGATFNGTSSKMSVSGYNPLSGLSGVTLQAWVKGDGSAWSGSAETILSTGTLHALSVNNGKAYGSLTIGGQARTTQSNALATLGTASFYFVTLTWSSGDFLRLYVNGVQVDTSAATYTGTLGSASGVGVGCADATGTPSAFLGGTLDEVAIYNRALTAAEIGAHYDARVLGSININTL